MTFTLLQDIYKQHVEFLRRNIPAPDLLLVPFEQKCQLLGEMSEKYLIAFDEKMFLNGMRLVYTDSVKHVTVLLSAEKLCH